MKLNIPERVAPDKEDFPNHPRKLKKWLASLKQANMGDYSRQIYNGIMQLNRQEMSVKFRLEDMEMLREHARHVFDQLHKYFINRTLPLPEKSLKIISLNQAVLNEMATGYKIIIFEAANGLNKVDNKALITSCERALHYISEILLRASQVYAEPPPGTWADAHKIYAYAEHKNIHKQDIKDIEVIKETVSIDNLYKQILLFSLSRPNALRQRDSERVFKTMPEWADYTFITANPEPNQFNRYFCSKLDSDQPPNCIFEEDFDDPIRTRIIDTAKLIIYLRSQIDDNDDSLSSISIGEHVSQETLRTLVSSWGLCAKRRFSRAERKDDIKVAIGLSSIFEAIIKQEMPSKQEQEENKKQEKPVNMFSLESIPDSEKVDKDIFAQQDPAVFITDPEHSSEASSASAWDMVAKGRTLTESYANELQHQFDELGQLKTNDPDAHWKITNVSAGGYCLRWHSDFPSKAQIGELIGVREKEPDHTYQWRIGVIRWMQYTLKYGLEIGVQILSPKVISCTVQRLEKKNEDPFNCLMLPGIKPIQQPSTLLLPAHAFKKSGMLKINVYERDMEIKLGTIREHTGSFTQFQFSQVSNNDNGPDDDDSENKNKSSNKPDNFDSIWTSL